MEERVTAEEIAELLAWMRERIPGLCLVHKDESPVQRLIARLIAPLNPRYLDTYTTVMFGRIYLPPRAVVASWSPERYYAVLRHELVHLLDARRFPLLFELSYVGLLPAVLTARAFWEFRGYTQDMIVEHERTGTISNDTIERLAARFTGPDYGWMLPFPALVRRLLRRRRDAILSGAVRGAYPYRRWGRQMPLRTRPSSDERR